MVWPIPQAPVEPSGTPGVLPVAAASSAAAGAKATRDNVKIGTKVTYVAGNFEGCPGHVKSFTSNDRSITVCRNCTATAKSGSLCCTKNKNGVGWIRKGCGQLEWADTINNIIVDAVQTAGMCEDNPPECTNTDGPFLSPRPKLANQDLPPPSTPSSCPASPRLALPCHTHTHARAHTHTHSHSFDTHMPPRRSHGMAPHCRYGACR